MTTESTSPQNSTDQTPLIEYARAHNIPSGFLQSLGWKVTTHIGRPCISFPTQTGTRYRFTDDQLPKYINEKGYVPCWYGLARALAKNTGEIYIVNGAASVLAADCIGIPAAAWMAGEGSIPDLTQLSGYSGRIIVAYDCDDAGRKGAIKLVQTLRAMGLIAYAYDLGLPEHGDVADMVGMFGDETIQAITSCTLLTIPAPVVQTPKPKPTTTIDYSKTNYNKLTAIQQAQLALDSLNPKRKENREDCLFVWFAVQGVLDFDTWNTWATYRDDTTDQTWRDGQRNQHSTSYNIESLFKWAHLDSPGWNKLGMDTPDAKNSAQNVTGETIDDLPVTLSPFSMSDALRVILNRFTIPTAAPLLELISEAIQKGLLDPDGDFSLLEIYELGIKLGRNVTKPTLTRAFNRLCGEFFANPTQGDSISSKNSLSPCDEIAKNLTGGRPAKRYKLLPVNQIISNAAKMAVAPLYLDIFEEKGLVAPILTEFLDKLDVTDVELTAAELQLKYGDLINKQQGFSKRLWYAQKCYGELVAELRAGTCVPMPAGWSYANSADYMACFARALIEANGGDVQWSKRKWAKLLGCKVGKVNEYLKAAGINILKEQTIDVPLKGDVNEIEKQIRALDVGEWDKNIGGFPNGIISDKWRDALPIANKGKFEALIKSVRLQVEQVDATISVRYHQSNRQVIATQEQPRKESAKKKQAVEPTIETVTEIVEPIADLTLFELPEVVIESKEDCDEPVRKVKLNKYQQWSVSLLELATDVQFEAGRLVDTSTGEINEFSTQLTFEMLL